MKSTQRSWITAGFLLLLNSTGAAMQTAAQPLTTAQTDIDALVAQMTLEEKASLMSGGAIWTTAAIARLGIPSIWLSDGPHGVRKAPAQDDWGFGNAAKATAFPTAAGLAATWNAELLASVGAALGTEARALGVNVLLGPGMNIKRSPLGGRNFEYFSEDPLLGGELAAAFVKGVQSRGVGSCIKHFAVNNQEYERMLVDAQLDERTLREIYLAGFEIAVKQARPWAVMSAYNRINGVYASENHRLLSEILMDEWEFDGFVVSDWGAVNDRVAGIKAGLHLEMPGGSGATNRQIVDAVHNGSLDEKQLDRLVARLLTVIFRAQAQAPAVAVDFAAHHRLARSAAAESIVLLKNDGDLLPLDNRYTNIAVIGNMAKNPRYQGAGSSLVTPTQLDSAWQALNDAGSGQTLRYSEGYDAQHRLTRQALAEAVATAQQADVAVLFLGLPGPYEAEGFDRESIDIPDTHIELLHAIAAVQPRIVVVLSNGGIVGTGWQSLAPAIMEAWLPGQAGGGAIADVLLGKVNPSGRLAETIPLRLADTPAYINFPGEAGQVRYGEGVFVGYRYYQYRKAAVRYPFGHGLSYTSFSYSDLKIRRAGPQQLSVSVKITNTGKRAGQEVVQLYVGEQHPAVARPPLELKAFAKIALDAGASKKVSFDLSPRAFAYWDIEINNWVINGGLFDIAVGASSEDIRLRGAQQIDGNAPRRVFSRYTPLKYWIADKKARAVIISTFNKLLAELDNRPGATLDTTEAGNSTLSTLLNAPALKMVSLSRGWITFSDVDRLIAEANGN